MFMHYDTLFRNSVKQAEKFWEEAAGDIHWFKPYSRVLDDSNAPFYRWFNGGEVNVCFNALDYHVANGRADAAAVSNTALKEAQDKGLAVKEIGRYGQPDVNYGYAVRKEDNDFRATLNEGLKRLKASPEWDKLVKKWFSKK